MQLLRWSSRIPQPAVIRSEGKSREGLRHRDEVTGKHAERTNAYKRWSKVGGRKNEGGRKPILWLTTSE
jgi:hypothetical protein